ncbi:HEAT repeat domain-containing protein [Leptolyngbya sp. 15MV]|nr:HEAT repeat domain-containing protein [Leptolyngbya sp. 15MV]
MTWYSVITGPDSIESTVPSIPPHLEPRLVAALGRTRHPATLAVIRTALGSDMAQVRAAAAEAAGKAELVDLAPDLAALLADPEWMVRLRAAEALLALGKRGVDQLREASDAGDPVARRAARTMLAERELA